MNTSDLINNIYYMFSVHSYSVNGYRVWTVIDNQTLAKLHTIGIFSDNNC